MHRTSNEISLELLPESEVRFRTARRLAGHADGPRTPRGRQLVVDLRAIPGVLDLRFDEGYAVAKLDGTDILAAQTAVADRLANYLNWPVALIIDPAA